MALLGFIDRSDSFRLIDIFQLACFLQCFALRGLRANLQWFALRGAIEYTRLHECLSKHRSSNSIIGELLGIVLVSLEESVGSY